MRLIPRFVSLLLTHVLIIGPLSAQTATVSPASPSNAAVSSALQVRVVDGESAEVAAGSRAVTGFVLEVVDSNGIVVPDAAIALRLPDADPTGTFADGTHAAVAYTDQTGRAKIAGIQWNATPGVVAIRVTASRGTAHAGILIQQTLTSASMAAVAPLVPQTPAGAFSPAVASVPLPPPFDTQPLTKLTPPPQSVPLTRHLHISSETQNSEPAVSVTSASPGESKRGNKTKWIILLAAVAAGAGVGVAMMSKKSPVSTAAATGISIGAPSISVGAGH